MSQVRPDDCHLQNLIHCNDPDAGHFDDCTEGSGYAGVITKSLTLKGLGGGATIDCGSTGSGLQISAASIDDPISAVSIEGFHFRNMNGNKAGGVEASNVQALSIVSSTFEGCHGAMAGAMLFQGQG